MILLAPWLALAKPVFAAQPLPYDGHYIGEIVPTPQRVTYSDEYAPLADSVCIVADDDPLIRLGAEELALHARRLGGRPPRVVTSFGEATDAKTVISLGCWSAGGAVLPDGLDIAPPPDEPEAYIIGYLQRTGQRLIWCLGRDALGAYWGAQSLLQLVSSEDGLRLRLAHVRDFPRFPVRCVQAEGLTSWEAYERALTWMPRYKLNYLAFGQNYYFPPDWRKWTPEQEETIRKVCNMARDEMAVQVMFHLHPHRHDVKMNIRISEPAEIDRLAGIGLFALDEGATALMLRSDDIYPMSQEDKAAFSDQAEAHAHLINELLARIRPRHPNALFLFCPPYYQGFNTGLPGGQEHREAYLRKLGKLVPEEVLIIWTGPITRSLEITQQQTDGFTRVLGRSPFLWDNTLYAHRSKYGYDPRHPSYLFDAFETTYPRRFYEATPGIVFNGGISEAYRVARINTADYFWNPEAYDPQGSLRKALALVGGPELVDDSLAFRDAYYDVFDAHHRQKGILLAEHDDITDAATRAGRLQRKIARLCPNEHLVEELADRLQWAESIADQGQRILGGLSDLRADLLLDLPFTEGNWSAETSGRWTAGIDAGAAALLFPWRTASEAGAHGSLSRTIDVPESPTGKLYLIFSASDDYTQAGTPPNAWPGYLFKQVLVDGEVVWEDDVEGPEPLAIQALQIADLTERLAGKKRAAITFRGIDKRGVGNMGAVIQFANAAIVPREPKLVRQLVSIPGDQALGGTEALSIVVRFRAGPIGTRQALFCRAKPFQYFAFLSEGGAITAGVFIGGQEFSAGTESAVKEGDEATFAFTYDGERVVLYLNGKREAEAPAPGPTDYVPGTVRIGSYFGTSQFFRGAILDTRIYDRPLSADEIAATSAEAIDSTEAAVPDGLSGWWREPALADIRAEDLSGSGRHGRISREWGVK